MAIKSRGPLGGLTLTGADAERFLLHMAEDKPNPAAQATLQLGRQLLAKMTETGSANLTCSPSK